MAARIETASGMPDAIKWALAVLLVASGVAAFYLFAAQALPLRVLYVLAGAAAGIAVALQTEKGRSTWEFLRDSRSELRRVVWPTRKETVQTTLIVIAMVAVLAILLWMLDGLLAWLTQLLLTPGE